MSNTEELKYVKYPLSKEDFTEDGIKYTISAGEFFRLISILQDTIKDLDERVEQLELAMKFQQLRNF